MRAATTTETLKGKLGPAKNGAQCYTTPDSDRIEPTDAERLKQPTPGVALLRTKARFVALPAEFVVSALERPQDRLRPVFGKDPASQDSLP
jgi:hypothetical protein